ncbi:MAG: hypothetical protein HZA31_09755 [Opitutae bacterium]|nr:hypothetical protein [Opitutae bacterium]
MSARETVSAIFRELVGAKAERLDAEHYLADVNSRITSALTRKDDGEEAILHADKIGFHLVDWQADAAFIVALSLCPERFTDEEIQEGIEAFLIHAPSHIVEAARLAGYPTDNFSDNTGNPPNKSVQTST